MAVALPVVAVRASGVCDIVQDGANGFMTAMDENDFISAMANTLLDKRHYEMLCNGAYQTAMGRTDSCMAMDAEDAYLQMINCRQLISRINIFDPFAFLTGMFQALPKNRLSRYTVNPAAEKE